ncbi:MAG: ABC transporter ATP-binding protein [Chloroflexi bacterium]|nr:ABC transporter ATP-binding protein [Chloroflexota bacterium]
MAENTLEVSGLTKRFGKVLAVDHITFAVQAGEIVGLLGPNGAGKTTTINMLLGLIKPSAGSIFVFGKDLQKARRGILERVGFSSAYTSMQSRLSVWENLLVFGHYYGLPRPQEKIRGLLSEFAMDGLGQRLYGALSSGQRTRINLVRALLHDPQLLLLDEPTASLDPDIASRVRQFLFSIRDKRKISMLYTSHNMEEVAQMCDRIIFLHHGRIVANDTPLALTKTIELSVLSLRFDGSPQAAQKIVAEKGSLLEIRPPNILTAEVSTDRIGELLTAFAKSGITLIEVDITNPDLEDVFLKFARKGQDEPDPH